MQPVQTSASAPLGPNQILYIVSILAIFMLYGSYVRKGVFRGKNIIWAGVFAGILAVGVSIISLIPYLHTAPLGLLAITPAMMTVLTAFCIAISYRQQISRQVGTYTIGDTKFIVMVCPPVGIPDADALILPTNTAFNFSDPVNRLVSGAAGPEMRDELVKMGPVNKGKVVSTAAGTLAVGRVFWVAIDAANQRLDATLLRKGIESALQQARKARAESVAIPLGPHYGLTMADGFEAVIAGALNQRKAFAEVVFLIFDARTAGLANTVAKKVLAPEETLNLSTTTSG